MSNLDVSLNNFPTNGFAAWGQVLDQAQCTSLRNWINERRPVDQSIFYETASEFEEKGRWSNYAPGRNDHNLLLSEELDLSFIENNDAFRANVERLVGPDWNIMKKAIIRSVPRNRTPNWVAERVRHVGRPNLNPFIRNEYQDVQYFLTTDFHQDKTRSDSNFVTVYVYLDPVDEKYSALQILSGSHVLGMTTYPHNLRRDYYDHNTWYYSDSLGHNISCNEYLVTGGTGEINCFHNLTLHGTGLNDAPDPRISLRYLIEPRSEASSRNSLLDLANSQIIGPKSISPFRSDVASNGEYLNTGSSLLSYS